MEIYKGVIKRKLLYASRLQLWLMTLKNLKNERKNAKQKKGKKKGKGARLT